MGKENGKDFSVGKSLVTGAWSGELTSGLERSKVSLFATQNTIPKCI